MIAALRPSAACMALALFLSSCGETTSKGSRRGDLQIELSSEQPPVRQADLDFGQVQAGTSLRRTVQVVNTGTDRAQITAVRFEDAAVGSFFVQAPDSVPPGEKKGMILTFAPQQAASYEARLVLEHDGFTLSASLNLTGEASAP